MMRRYWMFVPRIPRLNGLDIVEMRGELVVGRGLLVRCDIGMTSSCCEL